MYVAGKEDRFIWGGDRSHAQRLEITFLNGDQDQGPWAKFEIILAPMDPGLAIQLLDGLTPDQAGADLPHTPFGLNFAITASTEAVWDSPHPIFVLGATPLSLSPDLITEPLDSPGEYGAKAVTFVMSCTAHDSAAYQWQPQVVVASPMVNALERGGDVRADCLAVRTDRQLQRVLRSNHFFLPHKDWVRDSVFLQAFRNNQDRPGET
jgi:hypothetical protein